ncbi:EAL domain-containing protein [Vibrio sp. WXL210]|uniref:EAL domain-containing protein n=1 Tax=Vibrio sp. WXL210 TaxID=3450709 RepID=UPI003EC69EDD
MVAKKYLKPQLKAQLVMVLMPLLVIMPCAVFLALGKVTDSLDQFASGFVRRLDTIIQEVYFEHQQVMNNQESCEALRDDLFFDSTFREMLLVKDGVVTCSSRIGETHADLSHLVGEGVASGEYLHNKGGDPSQRTLVIVNTYPNDARSGVLSVIERNYFDRNIGKGVSDGIYGVKFRLGHQTYPEYEHFESDLVHVLADSASYGYQVIVEANPAFVRHMMVFVMLQALFLSLVISLLLLLCRKALEYRNSVVDDLKRGLERNELFLVYQPIVSSQDGQAVGAEVLIRWQHPSTGMISPEVFVPLAEQYGLVNRLTDFVLHQLQRDLNELDSVKINYVAVNVPPQYLHHQINLDKILETNKQLLEIGLKLCVEITERQFLDGDARKALTVLKENKIKVSLDDFGTGQTALSVIQKVHFDVLKVDKCFIDSIGVDAVNSPVLESIINLGHRLNVEIVAEGVETQLQADFLSAAGAHYQQGYLFSRPLTKFELAKL